MQQKTQFMPTTIKVFAPASVANVAVGYDILGFALEKPGDEVIVRPGNEPGLKITAITGAKNKLPTEVLKNTAGYAAYRLLQHLGEENHPLEMEIHKKMPFGSGLGSSAASAVAGVMAVNEYLKTGLSKSEILRFAVEGEQIADGAFHADNVAPSLLGGMILIRDNETLDYKKIHVPSGLFATIIYPHITVLTKDSRAILSSTVELKTMIKQSGNLASFIAAMYTADFALMKRSLEDLIIEPQRAALIPGFYDLKEMALKTGCMGFSISGAGPSMFALSDNSHLAQEIADKALDMMAVKKIKTDVYVSKINPEGAFRF